MWVLEWPGLPLIDEQTLGFAPFLWRTWISKYRMPPIHVKFIKIATLLICLARMKAGFWGASLGVLRCPGRRMGAVLPCHVEVVPPRAGRDTSSFPSLEETTLPPWGTGALGLEPGMPSCQANSRNSRSPPPKVCCFSTHLPAPPHHPDNPKRLAIRSTTWSLHISIIKPSS